MTVFFLSMKNESGGQRSVFSQGGGTDADTGKSARWNGIGAARMPRPAFAQPAKRETQAGEQAVLAQRLAGIVRAGGGESAAAGRIQRGQGGRNGLLVNPDEPARSAGGPCFGKTSQGKEASHPSPGGRVQGG